ncbi:cyclase [Coprinopsis marcescibilis]|uniref:Cyclase n=1 Tax=Coprinopsis marcescibilis TaxID=230819 RepID=A0A5C3L7Z5_COPMA|nr:cyclase [Coprinopsis marcescibilis]
MSSFNFNVPRIVDLTRTLSPSKTPQTIYPGDPEFHLVPYATISKDGYSVHNITFGTHTGTHIDAPSHFVEGGKSIDKISLDDLLGKACVIDFTRGEGGSPLRGRQKLEWEDLEGAWARRTSSLGNDSTEGVRLETSLKESLGSHQYSMLLVNTGWSDDALTGGGQFDPTRFFGHPYFSSSIATELLLLGVKVFGTDLPNPDETPYESADPLTAESTVLGGSDGYRFHELYLAGEGLIVENLSNLRQLGQGNGKDWVVGVIPLKLEDADGSPVRAYAYRSAD